MAERAMRILQVAHGFPPDALGGVEVFAACLSRELRRTGHRVTVFHRGNDPSRPEYDIQRADADGLPVVRLNHTLRDCDRFERTYRNETIDRRFGEVLDREQPDVVHLHHLTHLSTGLVRQCADRRIPTVLTLHDYWLMCGRGQLVQRDLTRCEGPEESRCARCLGWQVRLDGAPPGLRRAAKRVTAALGGRGSRVVKGSYRALQRAWSGDGSLPVERVRDRQEHVREVIRLVDRFLAPSQFLRRKFVGFGVPAERVSLQPYGFDRAGHAPSPGSADGIVRFGFLGTWIPTKGLHLLVEAFRGLPAGRAMLRIFGGPAPFEGHDDYEATLRHAGGRSAVRFEGRYHPADVGRVLASLDVVVVPSLWEENAPLTIQEAMLSGVPVVASDVGGVPELLREGVDGLLVPPGDVQALRAALCRFVDDGELRGRLRPDPGRVAPIDRVAAAHAGIYRGLVRTAARTASRARAASSSAGPSA